jgi:hypothetical protein
MKIIVGTVCITLSVFFYCIVLLGVRDPRKPRWAADALVGNVYIMFIMALGLGGLLAVGSALISWNGAGASIWHLLISAALLAAMVAGVKLMRIKERLARLESMAAGEAIVKPLPVKGPGGNEHRPDTPKMAA